MSVVSLDDESMEMLEAMSTEDVIVCIECGATMDDTKADQCSECGWINPLVDLGLA